jgi:hypothetical protein
VSSVSANKKGVFSSLVSLLSTANLTRYIRYAIIITITIVPPTFPPCTLGTHPQSTSSIFPKNVAATESAGTPLTIPDLHSSLLSTHQQGPHRLSTLTLAALPGITVRTTSPPPTVLLRYFCHLIGKECRNLSS